MVGNRIVTSIRMEGLPFGGNRASLHMGEQIVLQDEDDGGNTRQWKALPKESCGREAAALP